MASAKRLQDVIKLLKKAAAIADENEITLGNGAEVGGLIGSMVDELEACAEISQVRHGL